MKRAVAWAFAAALAAAPAADALAEPAGEPYGADARVVHVAAALAAVSATPPPVLQKEMEFARSAARGACSAGTQRVRVECLMIAMDKRCRERGEAELPRCRPLLDVLVANVLADERLIPTGRRYEIMRSNKEWRRALADELRRIQGALAVDFRLHAGEKAETRDTRALASAIDGYCLATANETKLPWQICVSSLVWFLEGPPP